MQLTFEQICLLDPLKQTGIRTALIFVICDLHVCSDSCGNVPSVRSKQWRQLGSSSVSDRDWERASECTYESTI